MPHKISVQLKACLCTMSWIVCVKYVATAFPQIVTNVFLLFQLKMEDICYNPLFNICLIAWIQTQKVSTFGSILHIWPSKFVCQSLDRISDLGKLIFSNLHFACFQGHRTSFLWPIGLICFVGRKHSMSKFVTVAIKVGIKRWIT